MKTWSTPALQELDVRLTAKGPGTVEQNAGYVDGSGWVTATYNQTTHEWNDNGNGIGGCLSEIKDS